MNEKLTNRIISGLETVRKWDADKQLLQQCRDEIPFRLLCPEQYQIVHNETWIENVHPDSPYANPDDSKYQGDDLFLKRLARYFKEIMTWVNNPPCELCGSTNTKCRNVRGAMSLEEREGEATRVEVYWCPNCNAETTLFPRYNSPRKLLETKKGRCGEYANLFGLYCRAVGFETRYILDYTDHVWTEVYSNRLGRWIMADSCEGLIDVPSMYEKGWGKKLNCILAFTGDSVTDVTRRYTRAFRTEEFQSRRRAICPSENQSEMIVAQFNESIWASNIGASNIVSSQRVEELKYRRDLEQNFFENTEKIASWDENEYSEGRQSGSLEWRVARGEAGNMTHVSSIDTDDGVNHDGVVSTTVVEVNINLKNIENPSKLRLRCEDGVVPSTVTMRLPNEYIPFDAQKVVTFSTKKDAFLKYIDENKEETPGSQPVIGFCTRDGLPVYLIQKNAYPFHKCASKSKYNWKTYHFVPDSLGDDEGGQSESNPSFPVPVEEDFFTSLLGGQLIKTVDGTSAPISTVEALENSRLVAFYFSAHWCPPCRRFTPMLVELYNVLKESRPIHGLECIFVSSDRDESSFNEYYGSMPWLALPFSNRSLKATVSQRFNVQGIPSVVVLDTISGNVVISKEICREEVHASCQRGDDSILQMFESWLDRIPEESKEIMETLKLSCTEEITTNDVIEPVVEPVVELAKKPMTKEQQMARIQTLFAELVAKGIPPRKAGVIAIKQVADEVNASAVSSMDIDTADASTTDMDVDNNNGDGASVERPFDPMLVSKDLVPLALKSIQNVEKAPSNVRFRSMKLGNNVFDFISRSSDGLQLLKFLGFEVYNADVDFVASIPLAANLSLMKNKAQDLIDNE